MLTLGVFFLIIGYLPAFWIGSVCGLLFIADQRRVRINKSQAWRDLFWWCLLSVLSITAGSVLIVWGMR